MDTVFIVDYALQGRAALARLVASAGYDVRLFDTTAHFFAEQDPEIPGCLLLDADVPATHGLEWRCNSIGSRFGRPVVMVSGHADICLCVNAMKAGAIDFLTKPIDGTRLFAALDEALRADREERRSRAIRRVIEGRRMTLTPRERQVMAQVVSGRLNKQIAADLGSGEKAVKVHRGRVMRKMGAHSIAELVQLAARIGIAVDPTLDFSTVASDTRTAPDGSRRLQTAPDGYRSYAM